MFGLRRNYFLKDDFELAKEREEMRVYEPDRYKDNIGQLITDFNNVNPLNRDLSEISRLYPNCMFIFNGETDEILEIVKCN